MKANYSNKLNRKKIKPCVNHYLYERACNPQEQIFEHNEEPTTTISEKSIKIVGSDDEQSMV